jgi:hypothetical protein
MSYEKATGLDATWLHMESEDVPLHVASCPIFQLEEDTDFNAYFEGVKQLVRERAPHLNKGLSQITSLNRPYPIASIAIIGLTGHCC